jgi:hypothetical protein
MNGQAALDIDARSSNERYSDEYRASLATQAKASGQRRARAGDPDGYALAVATILRLLVDRDSITADDVQAASPIRSNAIGSAFGSLARAGRITCVGYTTARRPEAHGRIQRIWGRAP